MKPLENLKHNFKLFLFIRDPIDRLISHINMLIRSGILKQDHVNEYLDNLLEKNYGFENFSYKNRNIGEKESLLIRGKFSEIIKKASCFDLIVMRHDELKEKPNLFFDKLYQHADLDKFQHHGFKELVFSGGMTNYLPTLTQIRYSWIGSLLAKAIPKSVRFSKTAKKLRFLYKRAIVKKSNRFKISQISPSLLKMLKKYYSEEYKILSN